MMRQQTQPIPITHNNHSTWCVRTISWHIATDEQSQNIDPVSNSPTDLSSILK